MIVRKIEKMRALLLLVFLSTLLSTTTVTAQGAAGLNVEVPKSIHINAGVLHAPPFASVKYKTDGTIEFGGFQVELLQRLRAFAKEDNVTFSYDLEPSPTQYDEALAMVANDCNTTHNPFHPQECQKFDVIIGDYYCNPARSVRVDFTPSWLRTTMSTIKYLDKKESSIDYTTLTQANQAGATVCVPDGTYLMQVVMAKFPEAKYAQCGSSQECLDWLKEERCDLYADDELMLQYRQSIDPTLEVTREQFNTQYLVWPMSTDLPPVETLLIKKWMYAAVSNATLDDLYFTWFQKALCGVGTAGENCELPCDPDHGTANAKGECVCESVKWTGGEFQFQYCSIWELMVLCSGAIL